MTAFRATLDELRDADLLLHVVDVHSPAMDDHIRAVETILTDLEMDDIPRLMVLNKMDLVAPEVVANLARAHEAVAIAARDRRTLPRLIERLQEVIWDQLHNDPRLVASGVS
jgi:GTP-binding protein HflX